MATTRSAKAIADRSFIELPVGWQRVKAEGPGPFVTAELLRRPDGTLVRWRSRGHRKGGGGAGEASAGTWWRPDRLSWWIGVLFGVGSICFAIAAVASEWASTPRPALGVTFFVGSLFFTAAAYFQYFEAVNAPRGPVNGRVGRRLRPASWEPKRIDWIASGVQLIGTLLFNVSTFLALNTALTARQSNLRVWAPDAFGSVCFLVASELAYAEVCRRWLCVRCRTLPWRIVALNLAGSVAFGVAALAALIEPSTNEPVSAAVDNVGTALGAVCFLAGATLLLPEAAAEERTSLEAAAPPA